MSLGCFCLLQMFGLYLRDKARDLKKQQLIQILIVIRSPCHNCEYHALSYLSYIFNYLIVILAAIIRILLTGVDV